MQLRQRPSKHRRTEEQPDGDLPHQRGVSQLAHHLAESPGETEERQDLQEEDPQVLFRHVRCVGRSVYRLGATLNLVSGRTPGKAPYLPSTCSHLVRRLIVMAAIQRTEATENIQAQRGCATTWCSARHAPATSRIASTTTTA